MRRQLPAGTEDAEQVLMAVQEQLLEELLKNEAGLEVRSRELQESDFVEAKENLIKGRESSVCLGEEWQEKRFLRFALFIIACFLLGQQFFVIITRFQHLFSSGSWKLTMK